jgi:hypothetical protein
MFLYILWEAKHLLSECKIFQEEIKLYFEFDNWFLITNQRN